MKAISHPLRMKILAAMSEHEASPSELAEAMGESLGVVSYHVQVLLELRCIELVRETPRRGAVEHHYRAVERPFFRGKEWAQLPLPVKRSISQGTLSEIWRDVGAALDARTFDSHPRRHLSWTNVTLDDEGWAELDEVLTQLIDDALAIQAKSLERLRMDGSTPPTSKLVLMHFEAAPAGRRRGAAVKKRRPKRKS